jgi:hypothetical protein
MTKNKTTKKPAPAPAKFELRSALMLQGEEMAPVKICDGTRLVAVTRSPWALAALTATVIQGADSARKG